MGTRKLVALAVLVLMAGTACGDDGDEGANEPDPGEEAADAPDGTTESTAPNTVPACEAIDPDVVADLFGGSEATEQPQGDSCTFEVSGGTVQAVALVDPQPASESWLNYKNVMQQGGQELEDVEGVGDEAYTFTPVPQEPQLVVRTGTVMFNVGFRGDESPEAMDALQAFAQHVVDYLSSLDEDELPGGGAG